MQFGFLTACLALGALGACLGAWVSSRAARAQLEAEREAFEQAREQAQRDLLQALLCIPQWMQQFVRVELESARLRSAERYKDQLREQQRWQSAQDERRLAEWQALLSRSRKMGAPASSNTPTAGRTGQAQLDPSLGAPLREKKPSSRDR